MDDDWPSRLAHLGLRPEEFAEHFVRSSGKGGQNVNKVATAVWLVHVPTGLSVKAMTHRTQAQNRAEARTRLLALIAGRRRQADEAARAARELAHRRTRQKSRAQKVRMLAEKALRGRLKKGRRRGWE